MGRIDEICVHDLSSSDNEKIKVFMVLLRALTIHNSYRTGRSPGVFLFQTVACSLQPDIAF